MVYKLIDQTSEPPQKILNKKPITELKLTQSSAIQFSGVRVQIFAAEIDSSEKIPALVSEVNKIAAFRRLNLNRKIINPNQHLIEISHNGSSLAYACLFRSEER